MFHPQGPTLGELVRQALTSTEHGYDLLAPKFDYTPFRTPDEVLHATLAHIAPGSVEAALDLCCGTGAAMRVLRPLCRQRLVGVDFSQGMLEVARQRLADAPGQAEIRLVRSDVLDMPFREEFDLATCFGALGHVVPADQPRFARRIYRALRPGGRFVFPTAWYPGLAELRFWLAALFDLAMRVRNLLLSPPFIMYYLNFLLPEAKRLLERQGFDVEVREGVYGGRYRRLVLVIATRPG